MHVDDAALVENPQVDGLAGQLVDPSHARLRFPDDVQVGQGLGPQFKQPDAEAIAILGVLHHIPTRLERLQEAIDRRLGHVQLVGDFRDAAFFRMLGQCLKHGHGPAHRRHQIVVWNDAVVHEGSNVKVKPKDIRKQNKTLFHFCLTRRQI
ncbi:hypothetical protein D3C76_1023780 [compost metagenome]